MPRIVETISTSQGLRQRTRQTNAPSFDAGGRDLLRVAFAAGAGGTADDVALFLVAPFAFRVLDAQVLVSTAVGGSTATLRTETGGGGSAASAAMSTAAMGRVRDGNVNATTLIPVNGTLVLRRSDNGVAGEVIVDIERV
jgi:hypothetical protein